MLTSLLLRMALPLALLVAATSGTAQDYPAKPVRFVVPHGAGGGTDVVARVFAQKMSTGFRQPVIVENKPGAGSQLGAEFVQASPADGYTMLFASSSVLTLPYLQKTRFELARDFIPVGQIGVGNFALVTRPSFPAATLQEFVAAVKANPGKYTYGSAGQGSANHLAAELLMAKLALQMRHIPYKSSGEMSQALMAEQIDLSIDVLTTEREFIQSRRVKGIATTGPQRDPDVPNLPTFNETAIVPGGYEFTFWFGLFLPAKTPAAVVERARREFAEAMRSPEVIERVKQLSLRPSTIDPTQFQSSIVADQAMWKKVIGDANIKLD